MMVKFGLCFRCGTSAPLFLIERNEYCERCASLCINNHPDYRKTDRRDPRHAPRGFGRRFEDPLRAR